MTLSFRFALMYYSLGRQGHYVLICSLFQFSVVIKPVERPMCLGNCLFQVHDPRIYPELILGNGVSPLFGLVVIRRSG